MAKIMYFGILPDRFGRTHENKALPENVTTVRDLIAWLRKRGGAWAVFLVEERLQVTVNRAFAEPDTPVTDNDEIALISKG